jgi:hypothetical protein
LDPVTAAQEAPAEESAQPLAPEVGAVVLANPIAGTATLPPVTCPTGRNKGEPVGEGYIFKISGKCLETATVALAPAMKITDVLFPDGEVRLEFKVVSGHERASFILGFRDQGDPTTVSLDNYQAIVLPGLGWAALNRGGSTELVVRLDLAGQLARDDWNSVAVRALGPELWFFVNDQLVGQTSDATYDSGRIFFALRRLGDPNDGAESAAVIRNLLVSRLTDADPARAPVIQQ